MDEKRDRGGRGGWRRGTYIPHTETRMVAMRRDLTNGARHMAEAKMRWLYIQAVRRSGLYLLIVATNGAILGGGLGVNPRFSLSGDLTTQGRRTEPTKVMTENITREKEPMRPTSPRVSVEFSTEACSS